MPSGRYAWRWWTQIACCGWLICAAHSANAQRVETLGVGTTVRVRMSVRGPTEEIGSYVRADNIALTLAPRADGPVQTHSYASITSLQQLTTERSLGQAWKRGSIIGGIAGLTIGGAAIAIGAYKDNHDTCTCVRKRAAIAYVLTPAIAAGTAALGGWISARTRNRSEAAELPSR